MQCGIPNHYPKFSKLHQFAYIIEPHHQKKVRCDQIQLKNIWGISLTLIYIYIYIFPQKPTALVEGRPFLDILISNEVKKQKGKT